MVRRLWYIQPQGLALSLATLRQRFHLASSFQIALIIGCGIRGDGMIVVALKPNNTLPNGYNLKLSEKIAFTIEYIRKRLIYIYIYIYKLHWVSRFPGLPWFSSCIYAQGSEVSDAR